MTAAGTVVPVHGRFRDVELSMCARAVLFVLLEYVNEFGGCYPSRRLLAKRIGRSVDTVDRAIRELVKAGVVRVQPQLVKGAKARLANNYLVPLAAVTAGENGGGSGAGGVAAPVRLRGRTSAAPTHPMITTNQHTRAPCVPIRHRSQHRRSCPSPLCPSAGRTARHALGTRR